MYPVMLTEQQMQAQAQAQAHYYQSMLRAQQQQQQQQQPQVPIYMVNPPMFTGEMGQPQGPAVSHFGHYSPPNVQRLTPDDLERLRHQQLIVQDQEKRLLARRQQDLEKKKAKQIHPSSTQKRPADAQNDSQTKKSRISPLNVADLYRSQQPMSSHINPGQQSFSQFQPVQTNEQVDSNPAAKNATSIEKARDRLRELDSQSPPDPLKSRVKSLFELSDPAFMGEKFREWVWNECTNDTWGKNDPEEMDICLSMALEKGSDEFWNTFDGKSLKFFVRITNWMRHLARENMKGKNLRLVHIGLKTLNKTPITAETIESLKLKKLFAKIQEKGDSETKNLCQKLLKGVETTKPAPVARPAKITTASHARPGNMVKKVVSKAAASGGSGLTTSAKSGTSTAAGSAGAVSDVNKTAAGPSSTGSQSNAVTSKPQLTGTSSSGFFDSIKSAKVSKPASAPSGIGGPTSLKASTIAITKSAVSQAKKPVTAPMTMLFSGASSIKSQIERNKDKAVTKGKELASAKKIKKTVRWKKDADLVEVKFISDDEDEEGDLLHNKKHASDRRSMDFHEAINIRNIPEIDEDLDWYGPPEFDWSDDVKKPFRRAGSIKRGGIREPHSEEKEIQKARESHTLISVYASPEDIPDNPSPPDVSDEANEIKPKKLMIIKLPEELDLNPVLLKFNEGLIRERIEEVSNATKKIPPSKQGSFSPPPPPPPPPPSKAALSLTSLSPPSAPNGDSKPIDLNEIIKFIETIPAQPRDTSIQSVLDHINSMSSGSRSSPPQSSDQNPKDGVSEYSELRRRDVRGYVRTYTGKDYRQPCRYYGGSTCRYGERCKNVHIEK